MKTYSKPRPPASTTEELRAIIWATRRKGTRKLELRLRLLRTRLGSRKSDLKMSQEFDQFDRAIATTLSEVKMFAHPDLPNGIGVIELSFSDCKVFICIDDEYDTLTCTDAVPESHSGYTYALAASFWDGVLGKALTNAWRMTNDRGYPDAFQLRFRELPNAGPYSILQMYGEASQITLTELKVVRAYSLEPKPA
jgi:uncharacterized protein DUF6334